MEISREFLIGSQPVKLMKEYRAIRNIIIWLWIATKNNCSDLKTIQKSSLRNLGLHLGECLRVREHIN